MIAGIKEKEKKIVARLYC